MSRLRFDLNDTDQEPSDEALATLMEAVAEEARRRENVALDAMLSNLRRSLKEAHDEGTMTR